nr:hypothetical protein [Tanacetum cinerariifolium]
MKARGTLLMELLNKNQLKFHSYQDVKLLMKAIEKRIIKHKSKYINVAFVSSNSTSTTNKADNTAYGVSTAHTQDGIGGYDWSYQGKEEHPTNYALMTLTSSRSSSSLDFKGNAQQKEYKEKRVIDSGCSRHMAGNKCYVTNYEDYDGGLFPLEMVKVEYLEKLLDKSQVLLRVSRKDNIYSVDLKSVVPTRGTKDNIVAGPKDTTLDAGKKATKVDESQVSDNGGPSFVNVALPSPINAAGTPASTNAFEVHPFERFSPFKNAFSLQHVSIMTLINDIGIFGNAYDDETIEEEVDMNNVVSSYTIPDAPLTKFLKDHLKDQTASTPMEPNKALVKDAEAEDVDVHLYISMIRSLMYLTTSRPDITFVVCACARMMIAKDGRCFMDIFVVKTGNSSLNTDGQRPTNLVVDETIYKEWEDKMERVATTASSLEAKQDNGNINRIQSMTTLNEPLPRGTGLDEVVHEEKGDSVERAATTATSLDAKQDNGTINRTQSTVIPIVPFPYGFGSVVDPGAKNPCRIDMFKLDETIYKEWEDKMERVATTASSLEAKQDNGNINRIQSMTTLNEPLPRGTGLGSGPRYALTMNPTVYASCVIKQKVIITEESIRRDLKFNDTEAKVHSPSSEIPVKESIPTSSNDPLLSEEAKIAQAKEIAKLKKRVKKLEMRRKSRPAGLRRLNKVGSSKQVESSKEKDSLGA